MSHPVPDAALDQHVAIIGKTGSGKSFLTRSVVERLLDRGRRVCILDYTGVWFGLRSGVDGKRGGYPVIIFGGEHADVPLNETAAAPVAKFIATGSAPAIIDLDGMTVGAQQRFVTTFLEELYRQNHKPLHLVIEEADEFAPQTGAPGTERMIGATARIFQRGRRKGFRAIAITQRPANLHKRVMAQCATLVMMKLMAPQDRKAVADWIHGHGDAEAGRAIIDSLSGLQRGHGHVWAPEQGILAPFSAQKIKTFDSMKAPDDDEQPVLDWAKVDLTAIKADMATAIEEAKANDPTALKKRIAELERQSRTPAVDQGAVDKAYERGLNEGYAKGLQDAVHALGNEWNIALDGLGEAVKTRLWKRADELRKVTVAHPMRVVSTTVVNPTPAAVHKPYNGTISPHEGVPMSKAERLIMTALVQYHPHGRTKEQIAVLTGYAVNGGAFNNALGSCRSKGWAKGYNGPLIATDEGMAALGPIDTLPTGTDLLEHWRAKVGLCERTILSVLSQNPDGIEKDELGRATGYEAKGGSFNNALGRLRTLELVERGSPIKLSPNLFG